MTARELCTTILERLGVIAVGETPSADDINTVFDDVNDLLDSWSNDKLLLYAENFETFALVGSQASYTVGPSANFDTVRPLEIQRAWITINSVDYPLTPMNNEQYSNIGMKAITSTIPTNFYYNSTFPNGALYIWPVPSQAVPITIVSLKQFVRFSSLNTSVSLPPGLSRAIKWNGIAELATAFGKSPTQTIINKAAESKALLKTNNSPPLKMGFDSEIQGRGLRYDIYTDGYR